MATKITIMINVIKATCASSSTARPCCGRAVRLLAFVIRAPHCIRDGRYLDVDQNNYLREITGNRPFEKLIRNYVYYQGVLQLFPGDEKAYPLLVHRLYMVDMSSSPVQTINTPLQNDPLHE